MIANNFQRFIGAEIQPLAPLKNDAPHGDSGGEFAGLLADMVDSPSSNAGDQIHTNVENVMAPPVITPPVITPPVFVAPVFVAPVITPAAITPPGDISPASMTSIGLAPWAPTGMQPNGLGENFAAAADDADLGTHKVPLGARAEVAVFPPAQSRASNGMLTPPDMSKALRNETEATSTPQLMPVSSQPLGGLSEPQTQAGADASRAAHETSPAFHPPGAGPKTSHVAGLTQRAELDFSQQETSYILGANALDKASTGAAIFASAPDQPPAMPPPPAVNAPHELATKVLPPGPAMTAHLTAAEKHFFAAPRGAMDVAPPQTAALHLPQPDDLAAAPEGTLPHHADLRRMNVAQAGPREAGHQEAGHQEAGQQKLLLPAQNAGMIGFGPKTSPPAFGAAPEQAAFVEIALPDTDGPIGVQIGATAAPSALASHPFQAVQIGAALSASPILSPARMGLEDATAPQDQHLPLASDDPREAMVAPAKSAVPAPSMNPTMTSFASAWLAQVATEQSLSELAWPDGMLSGDLIGSAGVSLHSPSASAPSISAPQMPNAFATSLSAQILPLAQSAQSGAVDLVLSPVELGALRFEIHQNGESVQIVLSAERPETQDLLRRNGDQLLQDFKNAGFSGASLSFGHWGSGGRNEPPASFEGPAADGAMTTASVMSPDTFSAPPAGRDGSHSLNLRL